MKEKVLFGSQVLAVLALVGASAWLSNAWRLDGSKYKFERKADGEVKRSTVVADAESEAKLVQVVASEKADRDNVAVIAEAEAIAKQIEAKAETFKNKMLNASNEAQVDAVRVIEEMNAGKSGTSPHAQVPNPFNGIAPSVIDEGRGPKPNAFETRPGVAPSVIDEGKPNNLPEPSHFEELLRKQKSRAKKGSNPESLWNKAEPSASPESLWKKSEPPTKKDTNESVFKKRGSSDTNEDTNESIFKKRESSERKQDPNQIFKKRY